MHHRKSNFLTGIAFASKWAMDDLTQRAGGPSGWPQENEGMKSQDSPGQTQAALGVLPSWL